MSPPAGKIDPAFEAEALQSIASAVEASDLATAAGIATRALNKGMRHPVLFNARGLRLEQQGRHEDALMEYRAASLLAPDDPMIHNAVGVCLININRLEDAVQAFEKAIAHRPSLAPSHYRRGWALGMLGDHERAQSAYERAIALDRFYLEPMTGLSSILCRKGDLPRARHYAESALLLQPDAPTAIAAMAMVELAEKSYAEAERRLQPILLGPDTALKARAYGFLGDALDGQDRFSEAFDAYTTGNDLLKKMSLQTTAVLLPTTQEARRVASFVRTSNPAGWQQTETESDLRGSQPREHVFIVGFMRSGTTLLQQVLSAHPDVTALDERDILDGLARKYLATDITMAALTEIGADALTEARAFYWSHVHKLVGNVAGKVFVDKLPFSSLKLPLIDKLFPKAKIVVAIRDPRDVVLSCFRQHLEISVTPPEFFSLVETAQLYSETMSLIEVCQEKLPLAFFTHRHESLIENFDGQVREICDFVGIASMDAMREFASSAPSAALRSPSAPQVRRGLYSEGIGQWRNYADQLAPVLPALMPWIGKFGYTED